MGRVTQKEKTPCRLLSSRSSSRDVWGRHTKPAAGWSCHREHAPGSGCCWGAQTRQGWAGCRASSVSANVATSGKSEHQEDSGTGGRSPTVTFGWQEDFRGDGEALGSNK